MFNTEKVTEECIKWIKDFFEKNGKDCNAVVGISGGKDSSTVAALCVKALGADRVIGVLMPCGEQSDIDMAYKLVKHFNIRHYEVNVKAAVDGVLAAMPKDIEISVQTKTNLPARVRMATLYAVAQSCNGRVANTCNLSEDWVGYSTRYGDAAGDFSPLSHITVSEIRQMGYYLGLPKELIEKPPIDGLSGKTDEDNLGFTYEALDKYIRDGIEPSEKIKRLIDEKHKNNLFKLELMPSFNPVI